MSEALTADEVIAHLGLKPHPDGGWYRETFRDERGHAGRAHSTAILYLAEGRRSGALAPRGRG
jgi:predicted cupin superfamily sugar epimerase